MNTTIARGPARAALLDEFAERIREAGLDQLSPCELSRLSIEISERSVCDESNADVFFPDRGGSATKAQKICSDCPVKLKCAAKAIWVREPVGIFGSLTERDRRVVVRKLNTQRPQNRSS